MSKLPIILILIQILSIKSTEFSLKGYQIGDEERKDILNQVFRIFKSVNTEINQDFDNYYQPNVNFAKLIYNIQFSLSRSDILNVGKFKNLEDMKTYINQLIPEYFELNEEHKNYFLNKIECDKSQWKKYDLVFNVNYKINSISVISKINDEGHYIVIVFTSYKKLYSPYKPFTLINESKDSKNPFKNIYNIEVLKKDLGEIINEDKDLLIRYYTILCFNDISQIIGGKFMVPSFS